jgi:hypothetical protein
MFGSATGANPADLKSDRGNRGVSIDGTAHRGNSDRSNPPLLRGENGLQGNAKQQPGATALRGAPTGSGQAPTVSGRAFELGQQPGCKISITEKNG